eukprot:g4687.t1
MKSLCLATTLVIALTVSVNGRTLRKKNSLDSDGVPTLSQDGGDSVYADTASTGSGNEFVVCTVNQPQNQWDLIQDSLNGKPFVLALQDFKSSLHPDWVVLGSVNEMDGKGSVAVAASQSFMELFTNDGDAVVDETDITGTTVKGTVSVTLTSNQGNHGLRIMSTHGSEGIRFKAPKDVDKCTAANGVEAPKKDPVCIGGKPAGIEAEVCRVEHYKAMMAKTGDKKATVWGSDMNVRKQRANGCPDFTPDEVNGKKVISNVPSEDFLGVERGHLETLIRVGDIFDEAVWTHEAAHLKNPNDYATYQFKKGELNAEKPPTVCDRIYTKELDGKFTVQKRDLIPRLQDHRAVCIHMSIV